MAQLVKNPPAMPEAWVRSLGWEDPLEKGKAAHSSTLAGKIPWTEEPSGLQSTELHPRSKHLLISWLQPPSAVILEPRKIKSDTVHPEPLPLQQATANLWKHSHTVLSQFLCTPVFLPGEFHG